MDIRSLREASVRGKNINYKINLSLYPSPYLSSYREASEASVRGKDLIKFCLFCVNSPMLTYEGLWRDKLFNYYKKRLIFKPLSTST